MSESTIQKTIQKDTLDSVETPEPISRMFKAGAHFAYSKSRRHPSMKGLIFGSKNNTEIFDLEKTHELLVKALTFVEELGRHRKVMLIVSGKHEAAEVIREAGQITGLPFVAGRWIGGTLTNFSEIRKRVDKYLDLSSKREKGELVKYTKKERLMIDRDIENLESMFGGIVSMKKLPDALFVIDAAQEHTAVTEAKKIGAPVIALMSSDCDLSLIAHPIVANDASLSSITFFVREVVEAYERGRKLAPIVPDVPVASGVSVK